MPLDDNKKKQLLEDIYVLYNQLYDITIKYKGIIL